MYRYGGHKHSAEIEGQIVEFDSDLEERVLRDLIARGFTRRWARKTAGLNAESAFYTPDLELAIERGGRTYRALVEIKPTLEHFHADSTLTARMRGIKSHYGTTYYLVYTDKEATWWQMNPETGVLGPCLSLEPGRKTMNQLGNPLSFGIKGRTGRNYRSNPHLMRNGALAFAKGVEVTLSELLKIVFSPTKPKRRYRRR